MSNHKYFLDANVIISGLLWKRNERKIIEYGEYKKITLVSSVYVFKEVEDVLTEMGFDETKIVEFLLYLRSFVEMVDVTLEDIKEYWDALDDKGDVPVLAAAVKVNCVFVTGDKKLIK